MSLTDDQVLRWFGAPLGALERAGDRSYSPVVAKGTPADIPAPLHGDWKLLKKHGYTDAEARAAIQPSMKRLGLPTPPQDREATSK